MKVESRNRVFAAVALFAMVVALAAATFAAPKPKKKKMRRASSIAALLPASDGAMTFDVARFFSEGMPVLLGGNKTVLGQMSAELDRFTAATGLDPRTIDEMVGAYSNLKSTAKGLDADYVFFARGRFAAPAIMDKVRKLFPEAKTETIGDRTIIIVTAPPMTDEQKAKIADKLPGDMIEQVIDNLSNGEMAFGAFDSNTLVGGTPERVRAALGDGPRLGPEITAMLARRPTAMMSFGAKLPTGLAEYFPLDTDDLGVSLKGIREMAGSLDVNATQATLSVAARTEEATQAKSLLETLVSLKGLGIFLKSSKRADQQIYGKIIDAVKLGQTGNEVTIDVSVATSDLNLIMSPKK